MDDITLSVVESSRPDPSGTINFAFEGGDENFIFVRVTLVNREKSFQLTNNGIVSVSECISLAAQYRRFLYGESGDFTVSDDDGSFQITFSPLLKRSQAQLKIQMSVWFHDGQHRIHLHGTDLFTSIDDFGALMAKITEWSANR